MRRSNSARILASARRGASPRRCALAAERCAGRAPGVEDVGGNLEGRSNPSRRALRAPAISSAPSGEPCALLVPALVGAPKPIVVLQAISVGRSDCAGGFDRLGDGLRVVAVDLRWCSSRTPRSARPGRSKSASETGAVDRDVVVVPEHDQLVELEMAGERDRLLADAFHQAAVAAQHLGVVIDEIVAERGVHDALGERHADASWRCPGRAARWSSRCRRHGHIRDGRRSSSRAGGNA